MVETVTVVPLPKRPDGRDGGESAAFVPGPANSAKAGGAWTAVIVTAPIAVFSAGASHAAARKKRQKRASKQADRGKIGANRDAARRLLPLWSPRTGDGPYRRCHMLRYSVIFLIIAIIAAVFGFGGIAAGAAEIAKILFYLFLVIFLVSLVLGMIRR
ncbi:hypothetical membrane protein [Azoarcus olearius]|nr:hypothetical membrane protein [Azoarcus olearius]